MQGKNRVQFRQLGHGLECEMEKYHQTQEGNGQRWLMIDLEDEDELYKDLLRLIQIRRGAN